MTKPHKKPGSQCCSVPTLKLFLKAASLFLSQKNPQEQILHDASDVVRIQRRRRRQRSLSASPLIVPMEARRRRRTWGGEEVDPDYDADSTEPGSPRVTCVGRIEIKRRKCKAARKKEGKGKLVVEVDELVMRPRSMEIKCKGKKLLAPCELVGGGDNESSEEETTAPITPPCLEKMMRFSSSRRRGPLTDFVWEEEKGVNETGNYSGGGG